MGGKKIAYIPRYSLFLRKYSTTFLMPRLATSSLITSILKCKLNSFLEDLDVIFSIASSISTPSFSNKITGDSLAFSPTAIARGFIIWLETLHLSPAFSKILFFR
ncbi:MAG TPA: hypothetical protein DCE02_01360 [Ruminiclostridium sp.]|jgi:hypothetical protein|nr:hypothetical protein [Ruminiclostridium sp.]